MSSPAHKIALLAALVLSSCATAETQGKVPLAQRAQEGYERGLAEFEDEDYDQAAQHFSNVKRKFQNSKYAVLAELALADTDFARGNYQEAIDAYRSFARLHPKHGKVDEGYVAFRIGESYFKDMPGDWFPAPPAHERDQSTVRDALRELNSMLDLYPDSKYRDRARDLQRQVLRRLVEHEVYAARFYLDRGHPKGAILRIREALRRYPDSGRDAELLLALGETHLEMGNPASAKQVFQRVVDEYGATLERKRADLFLGFIKRRFGDAPQDRPAAG